MKTQKWSIEIQGADTSKPAACRMNATLKRENCEAPKNLQLQIAV